MGLPSLSRCRRYVVALPLLVLAACAQNNALGPSKPSDFIVISDFAVLPGVVRLDPSFGFSLYRGEPGVPVERRAGSIGHAVAFLVTDTITDRLRALGYDATSGTNPNPARSSYRGLIVSGTFRDIDEGQRRHPLEARSAVVADVTIKAELPGGGVHPVQSFTVDSRNAPKVHDENGATRRETGVDADATNVGAEIARVVGEVAHRNNWLPAKR